MNEVLVQNTSKAEVKIGAMFALVPALGLAVSAVLENYQPRQEPRLKNSYHITPIT